MIKPKRMNVLTKGEQFDKIQIKDRKPTKRRSLDWWIYQCVEYEFETIYLELETGVYWDATGIRLVHDLKIRIV